MPRRLVVILQLFMVFVALVAAVPMDALRSFVSARSSTNATAEPCVAVRVEEARLVTTAGCPLASMDTWDVVHDVSLVEDTGGIAFALSTQSIHATSTQLWHDDALQVLELRTDSMPLDSTALILPRTEAYPAVLTEDAAVSIVDVDVATMRVTVIDHVVYVDNTLCLGDAAAHPTSASAVVCVLPRNIEDRGSHPSSSSSSSGTHVARFLVKHDAATGDHVLLGLGVSIVAAPDADGFRLFTWLRTSVADPTLASLWRHHPTPVNSDRVLGPPVAAITPFNHFVAGIRATGNGVSFCTGSLILPRFVLTAAHCIKVGPVKWVTIGSLDRAGAGGGGERIAVKRTFVHPQFQPSSPPSTYDVMVLELTHASSRTPIQLLSKSVDLLGTRATVMGYGAMAFKGNATTASTTLRSVDVPIGPSIDACAQKLGLRLDKSMLCAGGEAGKDACFGDSGAPLVTAPGTSKQRLVAVVSFGDDCGKAGYPGVYTSVSATFWFIFKTVTGLGVT